MKNASSARRVPRKIGQDEEEPSPASTESESAPESTLKRPIFKPRKGTSLRKSFGPTAVEDGDEEEAGGVVTPKRQGLSRIASQRNAARRAAVLPSNLATRQDDDDGPSYSAASLQELKNSTPTTPRDLGTDASASEVEDVEKSTQALDLSSKFGTSLDRYKQSSAIPSAAEIEEKKARRARMAKEQAAEEFISLDPDDPQLDEGDDDENVTRDENGRLVLKPKDKYGQAESRLVRDDEDIMENFEDFTEADGKILLGRKAEAEAARKRRQDMATQIAQAEGAESDSDASNTSEHERNEAFEAAQTKHGTYAENTTSNDPYTAMRPRTPPKISPLPTLDGVLERLRNQVVELQTSRMAKMKEMDALQREKVRLGEEEVRIQRQLKETGEWYARLRAEKGLEGGEKAEDRNTIEVGEGPREEEESASSTIATGLGFGQAAAGGGPGLGFGASTGAGLGFATGPANTDSEEDGNLARPGLGLGAAMAGRGLESFGTSTAGTPAAESD